MSHHAQLSPEVIQKLQAQKRNSTISAIVIALIISALLLAILFYIALSPIFKNEQELVSYSAGSEHVDTIEKPELTNEVEKKPSSPSSSMAKVIAANTLSPTAIAVPKDTAAEPSLDFGNGNDFGDGWGGSGFGDGAAGAGGGGASFFKQEVKAQRIAYVIDYSSSMRNNGRLQLMKAELSKSIESLPDTVDYSLIFFAGPSWVAGDTVSKDRKEHTYTVTSGRKEYHWTYGNDGFSTKPSSNTEKQQAQWLKPTRRQKRQSLEHIEATKLVGGTVWQYSLEMALDMTPRPDIIFFMTDGSTGSRSADVAKNVANKAKNVGVIVNTIALMEPKARKHMAYLAKTTGGIFTMVEADGSIKQIK